MRQQLRFDASRNVPNSLLEGGEAEAPVVVVLSRNGVWWRAAGRIEENVGWRC